MKHQVRWLKWIGGAWLSLGIVGVVWGAFQLLSIPLDAILPFHLPHPVFFKAFYIRPWTEITTITISLFLIISGWALIWRHSWTQTLIVPAHLLFAVYALVGWIAAYTLQSGPQTKWPPGLIVFLALALLNGGISLLLSSVTTTEALSWQPLQTTLITPSRCEFCGTLLDPRTGLCPKCEMIPEIVPKHTVQKEHIRARLINVDDDTEFWIDPNKQTFIGRGLVRNDINLDNPTVSRRHAQIEYRESRFVLTAMDDANGTFVNNALIRQRTLNNGDKVRFGRARFRFLIDKT